MTRPGIVVTLGFLIGGDPVAGASGELPEPTSYWASALQYAQGDRRAAAASFASLSERDMTAAVKSAEDLANAGRRCVDCEARRELDALPIRAAILLHAELERAERAQATAKTGGRPVCAEGRHGASMEKLLKSAGHQTGGSAFLVEFQTAQALSERSMLCFREARQWAEAGLKSAAKEPLLHLASGMVEESLGVFGGMCTVSADKRDTPAPNTRDAQGIDPRKAINKAVESFSRAITLNPVLVEAHLRLGRLQHCMGKVEEARKSLRQAVSLARGPLLYLAHLFLGQSFESDGDLLAAIREYRLALVPEPGMQTASVALAHALVRQGQPAEGREMLERPMSGSLDRRQDPFWFYFVGNPAVAEALFERLFQGLPR